MPRKSSYPQIRHPYSPRHRVAISDWEPSMTKQSFQEMVNVNEIMRRFTGTGTITHLNTAAPNYGYHSGHDFRESLEIIQKANESFDALPAIMRRQFNDNPAEFLDFVSNPENAPKMAEMGLLSPEATEVLEKSKNAVKGRLEASHAKHEAYPDGHTPNMGETTGENRSHQTDQPMVDP